MRLFFPPTHDSVFVFLLGFPPPMVFFCCWLIFFTFLCVFFFFFFYFFFSSSVLNAPSFVHFYLFLFFSWQHRLKILVPSFGPQIYSYGGDPPFLGQPPFWLIPLRRFPFFFWASFFFFVTTFSYIFLTTMCLRFLWTTRLRLFFFPPLLFSLFFFFDMVSRYRVAFWYFFHWPALLIRL